MKVKLIVLLSLFLLFTGIIYSQTTKITEDDPRWDCKTMGNKICGPNAPKPAIYCGAITKKGTPCKNRVKNQGDRCWRHKGK